MTSNSSDFNSSTGSTRARPMSQPGFLTTRRSVRQRGGTSRDGGGGRGRGRGASRGGEARVSVVMCNCEEEAVLRTVQKEGPNKGKQFYTCSKPREHQCRFFEWADNVPPSSVQSYSTRGGRGHGGRGGGNSWRRTRSEVAEGSRKRAPSTCSVCREVGHTKRTCPQLKST